jgi:putative endonuclease
MWYVYAIISEKNGFIYVGMCLNLERRLKEHNAGKSKFTKAYIPWKLLYAEFVGERNKVRIKEKYLKSGIGKEFLKNLVS